MLIHLLLCIIYAVNANGDQCNRGILMSTVLLQTPIFDYRQITDKVREEAACPPPSVLVGGVCTGKNCDTITMRCANITDVSGRRFLYQPFNLSQWTVETTDGSPPVFCPPEQMVVGLRCHGRRCGRIALQCAKVDIMADTIPFRWVNITMGSVVDGGDLSCQFTDYFHDKNYRSGLDCPQGGFVRGLQCRDSNCGAVSLYCCNGKAQICS
jgi:hypothetical protein